MIKVKISKDTSKWQKVRKNLASVNGNRVQTGWWGGSHPSGHPPAQIAKWGEEGHFTGWGGYSPPRPFITVGWLGAISLGKGVNIKKHLTNIVNGEGSIHTTLRRRAEESRETMVKEIRDWTTPPNSQTTIDLKGFNDPLVETGALMRSVESRVVLNGES